MHNHRFTSIRQHILATISSCHFVDLLDPHFILLGLLVPIRDRFSWLQSHDLMQTGRRV